MSRSILGSNYVPVWLRSPEEQERLRQQSEANSRQVDFEFRLRQEKQRAERNADASTVLEARWAKERAQGDAYRRAAEKIQQSQLAAQPAQRWAPPGVDPTPAPRLASLPGTYDTPSFSYGSGGSKPHEMTIRGVTDRGVEKDYQVSSDYAGKAENGYVTPFNSGAVSDFAGSTPSRGSGGENNLIPVADWWKKYPNN